MKVNSLSVPQASHLFDLKVQKICFNMIQYDWTKLVGMFLGGPAFSLSRVHPAQVHCCEAVPMRNREGGWPPALGASSSSSSSSCSRTGEYFFIKCFIDTVLVLLSRCMYFFEACLLMFSAVVHNFSTLHQLEYSLLLCKQYHAS